MFKKGHGALKDVDIKAQLKYFLREDSDDEDDYNEGEDGEEESPVDASEHSSDSSGMPGTSGSSDSDEKSVVEIVRRTPAERHDRKLQRALKKCPIGSKYSATARLPEFIAHRRDRKQRARLKQHGRINMKAGRFGKDKEKEALLALHLAQLQEQHQLNDFSDLKQKYHIKALGKHYHTEYDPTSSTEAMDNAREAFFGAGHGMGSNPLALTDGAGQRRFGRRQKTKLKTANRDEDLLDAGVSREMLMEAKSAIRTPAEIDAEIRQGTMLNRLSRYSKKVKFATRKARQGWNNVAKEAQAVQHAMKEIAHVAVAESMDKDKPVWEFVLMMEEPKKKVDNADGDSAHHADYGTHVASKQARDCAIARLMHTLQLDHHYNAEEIKASLQKFATSAQGPTGPRDLESEALHAGAVGTSSKVAHTSGDFEARRLNSIHDKFALMKKKLNALDPQDLVQMVQLAHQEQKEEAEDMGGEEDGSRYQQHHVRRQIKEKLEGGGKIGVTRRIPEEHEVCFDFSDNRISMPRQLKGARAGQLCRVSGDLDKEYRFGEVKMTLGLPKRRYNNTATELDLESTHVRVEGIDDFNSEAPLLKDHSHLSRSRLPRSDKEWQAWREMQRKKRAEEMKKKEVEMLKAQRAMLAEARGGGADDEEALAAIAASEAAAEAAAEEEADELDMEDAALGSPGGSLSPGSPHPMMSPGGVMSPGKSPKSGRGPSARITGRKGMYGEEEQEEVKREPQYRWDARPPPEPDEITRIYERLNLMDSDHQVTSKTTANMQWAGPEAGKLGNTLMDVIKGAVGKQEASMIEQKAKSWTFRGDCDDAAAVGLFELTFQVSGTAMTQAAPPSLREHDDDDFWDDVLKPVEQPRRCGACITCGMCCSSRAPRITVRRASTVATPVEPDASAADTAEAPLS